MLSQEFGRKQRCWVKLSEVYEAHRHRDIALILKLWMDRCIAPHCIRLLTPLIRGLDNALTKKGGIGALDFLPRIRSLVVVLVLCLFVGLIMFGVA